MKTVMKRIFSLMLVAVLLVSAVPTAFADEAPITCATHGRDAEYSAADSVAATCTAAGVKGYLCKGDPDVSGDNHIVYSDPIPALTHVPGPAATCNTPQTCTLCGGTLAEKDPTAHKAGPAATCTTPQTCTVCGGTLAEKDPTAHKAGPAATCTAPQTCTVCGGTLADATGHNPGPAATCTSAQTCVTCGAELEAAKGHDYGTDGNCKNGCGTSETSTHEVYFSVNGNQNFWHLGVKHNHTVKAPGFTYGTDYTYLNQVGDTETQKFMGWSKNPSDTIGSALEYIIEMPVKESVVYYAIYQAKETSSGSTGSTGSGSTGSGSTGSGSSTGIPTGSYTLNVWAKLHIGEKYEKTILLDQITGLGGSAKAYQVVAANIGRLESKFPSGYHGIQWHETVYYKVKDNKFAPVDTRMEVGEEDDVFINLYSGEKLVVVNVHTSKSYSYDRSVRIEGKRIGDLVTYEDVKKAVSKHYNFSSLSIYTYDEMEKLIAGKDANKTHNFIVEDTDNVYEVYLSGSSKTSSSSSSSKADSSNPKTGDMIFAPVAVMGLSVSALAVLFYLNKKRAY